MVQCRVQAIASELQGVRRRAEDAAAGFGFGQPELHEFVFAVNEAVTNAIRHGRPFHDGTIALRFDADGDTLICSVSDGGRFETKTVDSDAFAEGGRGLAAMAHVMDQIDVSTSPFGTTIRLHKRRNGSAGPGE